MKQETTLHQPHAPPQETPRRTTPRLFFPPIFNLPFLLSADGLSPIFSFPFHIAFAFLCRTDGSFTVVALYPSSHSHLTGEVYGGGFLPILSTRAWRPRSRMRGSEWSLTDPSCDQDAHHSIRVALDAERELLRCLAEKEPTFAEISHFLAESVLRLIYARVQPFLTLRTLKVPFRLSKRHPPRLRCRPRYRCGGSSVGCAPEIKYPVPQVAISRECAFTIEGEGKSWRLTMRR